MLEELNSTFAIDDCLTFRRHASGLIEGVVRTQLCHGSFFLHGAHVAEFQPVGAAPILFMSGQSQFSEGAPIRGGVPICFPWFGPHPSDSTAPAHGLARTKVWDMHRSSRTSDGKIEVTLSTLVLNWQLTYLVTFGAALDLSLEILNASDVKADCEVALHTYFQLANVHSCTVTGLESRAYLDKLTGQRIGPSEEAVRFTGETDRIYFGSVPRIAVENAAPGQRILISPRQSATTVVWNPWIDKSRRMPDFGDEEYLKMCCVETANVAEERLQLEGGQSSRIGVQISASPS